MFCKKCGKDIDIKSKVCPYCGEDTDFLVGIDGDEKPEHLKTFEKEINTAFNGKPVERVREDAEEYEDISTYTTSYDEDDEQRIARREARRTRTSKRDSAVDDTGKTWKYLAGGCAFVIVVCLIIILVVSCGSDKSGTDTTATTPTTVATTAPTTQEETTTVPTTEKSIDEYLDSAVANDTTAVETAQGFYSNLESACASGDYETFKSYFSSVYTDAEIKKIFNENKDTCATYQAFIPGYTTTVSCDKYIYVYIAATTNMETGDYVENTFVLSSDNGAFKLDMKSDGAKDWLLKAPTIIS